MPTPINQLWKQRAPRTDSREESRHRTRALTRLAYEVAHMVRKGSLSSDSDDGSVGMKSEISREAEGFVQGQESLRLTINQLMRDDESLRLVGFSECDRAKVLNAARSLLTNEGRR